MSPAGLRLAALPLLFAGAVATAAPRQGSIEFGGHQRNYLVDVPPSYDGRQPLPLVLVFHGGSLGSAAQAEKSYGFRELAGQKKFIAVFPEGIDHHWNDGRNAARLAGVKSLDDVGFVAALIDQVAKDFHVDAKRIYATGISNGAIFSYLLATKLSPRLAAVAPIAGALAEPAAAGFALDQPVAVIAFHGTEDKFVPFAGGKVIGRGDNGGRVLSVADTLALFVQANGCAPNATTNTLPAHSPSDGTTVRHTVYAGGREGSAVELYTVEGGGHTWPGRASGRLYAAIAGRTTQTVDATQLMWEFFERHPKR